MSYWDEKYETMPPSELKELQLIRLRKTVKSAYETNIFYRKKLKKEGVKPSDIKSLDDITKIPFLTKDELHKYFPFGLLCTSMENVIEIHASSGTTGKPVVGTYTRHDLDVWSDVMARALYANGLRKGDIMQNAYGYGLFTGAHGFEKGAQKIGATVIPVSSGNTKRQISIMKDFGTTALASTPSYALYMAEVSEEMGFSCNEFNLRLGLFGAEGWSDKMRKSIEKKWGIEAYEHYGLTEIIGPGVVSECKERKLHINADHFLPEIIDPKTGEQCKQGDEGELTFTTLTKEAFPVLRFRTKDIATFIEAECDCGRTLPIQSRIKGRADDMMKIKGVIVFPSQIEEAILRVQGVSGNYQLVKKQKGQIVTLHARVEPTDEKYKEGKMDELRQKIEDEIYTILNLRIPTEMVRPGTLPRSEGKAKRIVEN